MKYTKLLTNNNKINTIYIYTFPAGVRNTTKYHIIRDYICLSKINVILYCVYVETVGVQKTI